MIPSDRRLKPRVRSEVGRIGSFSMMEAPVGESVHDIRYSNRGRTIEKRDTTEHGSSSIGKTVVSEADEPEKASEDYGCNIIRDWIVNVLALSG
jgi:hypothetical protein